MAIKDRGRRRFASSAPRRTTVRAGGAHPLRPATRVLCVRFTGSRLAVAADFRLLMSLCETNNLFFNRLGGSNMPVIVALDLPLPIMSLMILYGEKTGAVLPQGVPLLLFGCASTCAGAAMAKFVAL